MQRSSGMHLELQRLVQRLDDGRGRGVVFVSHCLLNPATRFLGGAGRPASARAVVEQCMGLGLGVVQLPCPEQQAWGGVLKRRLLALYGAAAGQPASIAAVAALLPVALRYTRAVYRRVARGVAAQIADYVSSGYQVAGIIGVDGSPSCGVHVTVDPRSLLSLAALEPERVTPDRVVELVRRWAVSGRGLFIEELERALRERGLEVPLLAHDLLSELPGGAHTRPRHPSCGGART